MKTPRELLLNRHQQAEPRLDAVRRQVIDAQLGPGLGQKVEPAAAMGSISRIALCVWKELIQPCRPAWIGLAALWMIIAAFNLMTGNSHQMARVQESPPPSGEQMKGWLERQRLLPELIELPSQNKPPPESAPQPRSERLAPRSKFNRT